MNDYAYLVEEKHITHFSSIMTASTTQSTLRPPEVNMFYWKIIIWIAYMYMGVDHVSTSCSIAKRNGSVCNTVTLTASESTK